MCNNCNNKSCNNSCKPVCNPCSKQIKIMYCGQPINCLDISRGDQLDAIIKKLGDKVCQQEANFQSLTYVNIEDATVEQCNSGGYVIQVINLSTGEVVEEAVICDTTFSLNNSLLGNPSNVNIQEGDNVEIEAVYNPANGQITYTFNSILAESITWQEGIDLMADSLVKPNVLYYISDRNWFLQGLDESHFSITGHQIESVVKQEYYEQDPGILGVWNNFISLPVSVGDLVVYGGKVFSNNSGSYGNNVDYFTLSADWTLETNSLYYEDKVLKMHVDYEGDWVFRQEDNKNNIINIPKDTYESLGNSNVWADWNMPDFYNNNLEIVLNNSGVKGYTTIQNNNGLGRIVGNNSSFIEDNFIQNTQGIQANNCTTVRGNTIRSMSGNTSNVVLFNIFKEDVTDNDIEDFSNNICSKIVSNNELPFVKTSIFDNILDNNTSVGINPGIESSIFRNLVQNNTLFGTGLKGSAFKGIVFGNTDIALENSEIGIMQDNTTLTINYSVILQATSNTTTSINTSKIGLVNNNTSTTLNNVTCTSVSSNTTVTGSFLEVKFLNLNTNCPSIGDSRANSISSNSDVSSITLNRINGDISSNARIESIDGNHNNGDIRNNESSDANLSTGVKIDGNMNNGFIAFNIMDLGVTIDNNNNNGDIGDTAIPVPRAASVSGVVVNL